MVLHVTYVANIYGYPFVVNIPAQSGTSELPGRPASKRPNTAVGIQQEGRLLIAYSIRAILVVQT